MVRSIRAIVTLLSFLIRVSISVIKLHDGKEHGEARTDFILQFGVHCPLKSGQELKLGR